MERWIWHNEELEDTGGQLPLALRLTDAVWQSIALEHGRALFVGEHIALAAAAYRSLYGADLSIGEAQLGIYIERLLAHNRMPARGGALLHWVLAPSLDDGRPDMALLCVGRLLYAGLQPWHRRLRATRVACDGGSFVSHTSASWQLMAGYCLHRARLGGFEAAIRCARGCVTGLDWGVWSADAEGLDTRGGVGEWPIFAVREREVFVPSLASGAADSVWRRIGIRALEQAGVALHQVELPAEALETLDELFAVTPQGVVGVLECDGRLFYNMMAEKLSSALKSAK